MLNFQCLQKKRVRNLIQFHINYLFILLGSILFNYLLSFLILVANRNSSRVLIKIIKLTGIIANLGVLFVFKYFDFFISNINSLFDTSFCLLNILLPLGISFFTFQQLSFVIDRCRGDAEHERFIDYLTFVTFFPQLIAGPIVSGDELLPQIKNISIRSFLQV